MGNKLWPRPVFSIDNVNEGRPAKPAIRTFGPQKRKNEWGKRRHERCQNNGRRTANG